MDPKNRRKLLMIKEVDILIDELVNNKEKYFDKNLVLNSEGRKLFSRIAKILMVLYPELRRTLSNYRSTPTFEGINKLVERLNEMKMSRIE
ncbi:MAG: hypothetical protein QW101_01310 [Ignisphaera sp.]|uniref:Uncharacterized protein n=1 Tax=Ignisphaera aggregans TaxID=334771 RepID=A0A7J3MWH6_9CREN